MKQLISSLTEAAVKPFDYRQATEAILKTLRRDRDRQIIARRFGFGLAKRQTLEKIGSEFGITRERVRQIEKAALTRMSQGQNSDILRANQLFLDYLKPSGGLATLSAVAERMGAGDNDSAYILFLANLAPDVVVIDEDDHLRLSLVNGRQFDRRKIKQLTDELATAVASINRPAPITTLAQAIPSASIESLESLASISKDLAEFDGNWGLSVWPEVNPKSIRDKTYLVLYKHGQPLHFGQIADHIRNSNFNRRNVTVQAVHNELIKDGRFILVGRGIYALAEWGYTPGTVADIIVEILREESPLHKDQIVERVLSKRQVKTTTIILNLQEKDQFERVAKATYKLRSQ